MTKQDRPEPPPPPESPRRVRLYAYQWVGLAFIAAMPALALAGVFGESPTRSTSASSVLAVTVRYPNRFRYRQTYRLEITVRNQSRQRLDSVRVSLDTGFVSRFSNINALPTFGQPFEITLSLAASQARLAIVEIRGDRYGLHRGTVTVAADGQPDTVRVPIGVRVFP